MSERYSKQLLTEVHKYNHIETSNTAYLSNNDLQYEIILHDQYTVNDNRVRINGPLPFGIYYFDGKLFILDIDMAADEYIEYIRQTSYFYVVRNNRKRHYLYLFNIYNLDFVQATMNNEIVHTGTMEFTVNTKVDKILITGNTSINISGNRFTPDSPAQLISTTKILLHSESIDRSKSDDMEIKLRSGLKSLPSGIGDVLILDAINNQSYRLNKIARTIITGYEDWVEVESAHTSTHSVYYYHTDFPKVGDNTDDVISNTFVTVSYSEMFANDNVDYAICVSNDILNNGFFIKVPNRIANDVTRFTEWLRSSELRGSAEPILVEYHMKDYIREDIALERYDFSTYHGGTVIVTSDNVNKISFFCKSIGVDYNRFIPTGVALDFVDEVNLNPVEDMPYTYPGGQNLYRYNPDVARLYGSVDKYYGYNDGNNVVYMPNQDYMGNTIFDQSLLDYRYYVSNENPLIDKYGFVPVGAIVQWYSGITIPDGWIYYLGQDISRTEYHELFEVLGTKWGDGDGSTTFGLPDQNYNEEDITIEEIESIGFGYIMCAKPNLELPIGACVLWYGNYDLPPVGYIQADGSWLNKIDYYCLYNVFGGKYGETDDEFCIPDQNVYEYADGIVDETKLENFSYIIKAL